ncbi:hypothetical protein CR513_42990, partial [Mucuna pruriens]
MFYVDGSSNTKGSGVEMLLKLDIGWLLSSNLYLLSQLLIINCITSHKLAKDLNAQEYLLQNYLPKNRFSPYPMREKFKSRHLVKISKHKILKQ